MNLPGGDTGTPTTTWDGSLYVPNAPALCGAFVRAYAFQIQPVAAGVADTNIQCN